MSCEKAPWISRLHFGFKYSRKKLVVYETSETATESPVCTDESAAIGQAFYRIKHAHT